MGKYLILNRKTGEFEANGFTLDGTRWHTGCDSVVSSSGGEISLYKPWFSSESIFYSYNQEWFVCSDVWLVILRILKNLGFKLNEDINYFWDLLMFQCPLSSRSFCEQISYVRGGERVSINARGDRDLSFSDINCSFTIYPDWVNSIRKKLAAITPQKTIFHLSSGLDSSILAIMASKMFRHDGIKVTSVLARGKDAQEEISIIERLVDDYHLDCAWVNLESIDIFSAGRELITSCLGYPLAHPSHLTRFLMDKCASTRGRGIVSGRGPDECLGGYEWHTAAYSNRIAYFKRISTMDVEVLDSLIHPSKKRLIKREGMRNLFIFHSEDSVSLHKRLQYDLLTLFESWNIIDNSLALALDVDYLSPFIDRELMRYFFCLEDERKVSNGYSKKYLRDSLSKYYPNYVLENKKIGLSFDVQAYLKDLPYKELLEIVYEESEFSRKYLSKSNLESIIRLTLENNVNYGWQIWDIYLCGLSFDLIHQSNLTNPVKEI